MKLPDYFTVAVLVACLFAIASFTVTSYVAARQLRSSHRAATNVSIAVTAVLGAWLAAVMAISSGELLVAKPDESVPPTAAALLVPIIVGVVLLRTPTVRGALTAPGTIPVLAVANVWRINGVLFVVLTVGGQLAGHFAWPAGLGDVAIGLAAPAVGWAIWKRPSRRRLAFIFNALGLLDLIMAVTLGVLSAPGALRVFTSEPGTELMTLLPMCLIPAFLVPLGVLTHLALFQALRSQSPSHRSVPLAPMCVDVERVRGRVEQAGR